MSNLNSFKAYDIRGRIPDEINDDLAYEIGRAYAPSSSRSGWRSATTSACPARSWPRR